LLIEKTYCTVRTTFLRSRFFCLSAKNEFQEFISAFQAHSWKMKVVLSVAVAYFVILCVQGTHLHDDLARDLILREYMDKYQPAFLIDSGFGLRRLRRFDYLNVSICTIIPIQR
jgi:hypothetical protein